MNTHNLRPEILLHSGERAAVPESLNTEVAAHDILNGEQDDPRHARIVERYAHDRHGLSESAPLAFASYKVAIECYPGLLSRTLGEAVVLQRLRKMVPSSPFELDYVARQVFKFINPRGHGANSARFNNETLGWFRQTYPEDAHLTAGLSLIMCAAKWWTCEQGHRSIQPRVNPLTTSDLDRKLKSFGFLFGEREAICRLLRPRLPGR